MLQCTSTQHNNNNNKIMENKEEAKVQSELGKSQHPPQQ
jgi:hypothetical protein